jgi:7-carboxy-7-deazaguanine synthase (Cx14CxxC type)
MSYKIKESFLTLQGEGAQAGRLAVFLRFAGCNNWSGRAEDRRKGPADCAFWCDTDFVGTDGDGGGQFELGGLLQRVRELWPHGDIAPYVVCTGGEPALQLDQALVDGLHGLGAIVAIETNGTLPLPSGVDWICVSPKRSLDGTPQQLAVTQGQEIKLVLPQPQVDRAWLETLDFEHFFVQPMDGPLQAEAIAFCMDWVRQYPRWRLSLQNHKTLGIR